MPKFLILARLAFSACLLLQTLARAQSAGAIPADAPASQPFLIGSSLVVRRFEFTGNTVYSNAQLQYLLAEYVGRKLTFELLDDARRKITDYYVEKGYITSGAILPEQDIVGGVVWIHVVEGRLEKLDLSGNRRLAPSFFDDRLKQATRPPLQIQAITDALEVLQQDPRIASVQGQLVPGHELGYALLDLKVQESQPYQLGLQLDNAGTPSTGAERFALVGSDLNLTGIGDSIVARFGPFTGGFSDPQFAPSNDIFLQYTRPIIGDSTSLILLFARNDLSLVEPPLSTLGSATISDSAAIALQQTLLHTSTDELNLTFTLSRRDNHTKLLGQNFSFADGAVDGWMTASAFRTALEWTTRSDAYVISARSTLSVGLDCLGATIHGGSTPDSQFIAWLGETRQAWRIEPFGATLLTRAAVQLASDRLLAVEQFSLGGVDTVRGYRESTLLTDDATLFSIELRHNLMRFGKSTVIDGALFTDFGYGWDRTHPSSGEALASVGCGLLYTITSHIEGEIYFGVPLCNRPTGDNLQDLGIHFRILVKAF